MPRASKKNSDGKYPPSYYRKLEELRNERRAERDARAVELGFDSWDQVLDHRRRERKGRENAKKNYRRKLKRRAAAGDPVARMAYLRREHRERSSKYPGGNRTATLTAPEWLDILASQGHCCADCRTPFSDEVQATVDHIVPVVAGGALVRENVQALCSPCNSARHHRLIREALWFYFHQSDLPMAA